MVSITFLDILVLTSVAHTSPSLTVSHAIRILTRSSFSEISTSQKSGHVLFCTTPPYMLNPPPMDLGRFEISKGLSNRGGWTLNLLRSPTDPLLEGGVDLGLFRKSKVQSTLQARGNPTNITRKPL